MEGEAQQCASPSCSTRRAVLLVRSPVDTAGPALSPYGPAAGPSSVPACAAGRPRAPRSSRDLQLFQRQALVHVEQERRKAHTRGRRPPTPTGPYSAPDGACGGRWGAPDPLDPSIAVPASRDVPRVLPRSITWGPKGIAPPAGRTPLARPFFMGLGVTQFTTEHTEITELPPWFLCDLCGTNRPRRRQLRKS